MAMRMLTKGRKFQVDWTPETELFHYIDVLSRYGLLGYWSNGWRLEGLKSRQCSFGTVRQPQWVYHITTCAS